MKKGGQLSAKLPTTIPILTTLGLENFNEQEIAYLTVQQSRGKPPAFAAKAREKFQSLYVKMQTSQVREQVAAHAPKNLLKETEAMFAEMLKAAKHVIEYGEVGFIVSGAPGIGKTYSLENYLEGKLNTKNNMRFRKVPAGYMTPVNLYMTLYANRHKGHVLLIDDNDDILSDPIALNILKGAYATKKNDRPRKVAWMSESAALKGGSEESDVPKEFDFEGSVIFISNLNLSAWALTDKGRHLNAVLDRLIYIDLKLHDRRQVMAWVINGVEKGDVLRIALTEEGISGWKDSYNKEIAGWIERNGMGMRSLSYRGAIALAKIRLRSPEDWDASAKRLLLI